MIVEESSVLMGQLLHYGLVLFLVGGSFWIFVLFWWRGTLDWSEDAKHQMFQDE